MSWQHATSLQDDVHFKGAQNGPGRPACVLVCALLCRRLVAAFTLDDAHHLKRLSSSHTAQLKPVTSARLPAHPACA